jgi:hypothetical protein
MQLFRLSHNTSWKATPCVCNIQVTSHLRPKFRHTNTFPVTHRPATPHLVSRVSEVLVLVSVCSTQFSRRLQSAYRHFPQLDRRSPRVDPGLSLQPISVLCPAAIILTNTTFCDFLLCRTMPPLHHRIPSPTCNTCQSQSRLRHLTLLVNHGDFPAPARSKPHTNK